MSATVGSGSGEGGPRPVTVMLPAETFERLMQFCQDYLTTPDDVIEKALEEYFREGDMSH